jgi:ligand-binding sensor domain-containing protein
MKYKLAIFFLFFSMLLHAQHPYSWDLTVEDGLPSLEVYDLYEDSKGYMWIGTDKGVCKYNGRTFTYYKNKAQKGAALSGIQEDEQGRIWARNFRQQVFYIEKDSLHLFEEIEELKLKDLTEFLINKDQVIYVLDKIKKSLYKLTESADGWNVEDIDLSKIGKKDFYLIFYHIELDGNGGLYILTSHGIYQLKSTGLKFIGAKELLKRPYFDTTLVLKGNILNKEKYIFILQRKYYNSIVKHQISELVDGKIKIKNNYNKPHLKTKDLLSLRYLSDNSCWVLTANGGVVELFSDRMERGEKGKILLPNEGVSDILIDREGNYWVSSLKNGVFVIPKLSLEQIPESDFNLSKGSLGPLLEMNTNNILIGTDQGRVISFNLQTHKVIHSYKTQNEKINYISWWKNKTLSVMGKEFHVVFKIKDTLPIEDVQSNPGGKNTILYKESLKLVSGGKEGFIFRKEGKKTELIPFSDDLFDYIPTITYKDKYDRPSYIKRVTNKRCNWVIGDEQYNRFLIAYSDTLMCYPEKEVNFPIFDEKGNSIQGTFMERGVNGLLWICTENAGVYALDKDLTVKYHLTVQDGLISNTIYRLRVSKEGKLWLLENQGVQSFNPETKESHLYTKDDGLSTYEIRDLILFNQKVWLSTAKGLVSFNENMPSKNEVAPLVYIKNISIHDKDTVLSDFYNLDYEQNNITINIEGLAYRSRGSFQYKYRMLGIDTVWRYQAAQINLMRFPQLQSGKYTFEVKAVNEDGVESVIAAQVVFCIGLPYWKTWWFILILVFFIVLIVLMIVRNQLRQARLESQNSNLKMEALQSQMNPHFIFNVLTAVQNLWLQHKHELAMDLQSNFAKLLRKIFQYSSKQSITIEQVEEFLNNYLNLEQIRFENTVEIDFKIEEILLEDECRVPPLLIQPIVENSFKHGLFHKQKDLKLSIHLKKEGAYLYCCVVDNGVGRKNKPNEMEPKRSSGLSTTKERLAILQESTIKAKHPHNNLRITDLKNSDGIPVGTKVELWIPFI